MIALSESVMKNCMERPLAEKSRWRHIRLAITPRYLGNHTSQIKSYYGTLSGSHDRSFRIRHEKSPETPLAEKSRWRHIRFAIQPRYLGNHASQKKITNERYPESVVALSESVMKNYVERPLAEKSRWRHIRVATTPRCLRLEWGSLIVNEDNSKDLKVAVGVDRCLQGSWRRNAVPPPKIDGVHESGIRRPTGTLREDEEGILWNKIIIYDGETQWHEDWMKHDV